MKPTPDDALGKLALAHLLGALEETEEALYTAYAADHPEAEAVLEEARQDLAYLEAPPVAAPESAWLKIQDQLRHKRAGSEPAQPLSPDDVILVSCSYCRDGLERGATVYCASCLAPHHGDCFREHGRCSVMGCGETQIVRATGHRDEPAEPAEPRAPRRPRRWRRRAGWGLVVLAGGAVAAYSGSDAFVAQVSGVPAETPSPREAAPAQPDDALQVPPSRDAQTWRVAWRGATLGEVVRGLGREGAPVAPVEDDQLANVSVADRDEFSGTAEELVQELASELDLHVSWVEPGGWRLRPTSATRLFGVAPRRRYSGSYLIEGLEEGVRTNAVVVDSRPVSGLAASYPSKVWAEARGDRLRVYEGATPFREVPWARDEKVQAMAMAPDGGRMAWIQGRRLSVLDLQADELEPRHYELPTTLELQEIERAILGVDAQGNVLAGVGERWWILPFDRREDRWALRPTQAIGWEHAPRFASGATRLVARETNGWWLFTRTNGQLNVFRIGIEGNRWVDERYLLSKKDPSEAEERGIVAAFERRSFREPGVRLGSKRPEQGLEIALGGSGVELLDVAFAEHADAVVCRRGETLALQVRNDAEAAFLPLDLDDGSNVRLVWQAPGLLSLIQWGQHRVAIHTVRHVLAEGARQLTDLRIERTLHAAVSGVQGVRVLRGGRFLLQLDTHAAREGEVWVAPANSSASRPRRRVAGSEVQFYSSSWAEPQEAPPRPQQKAMGSIPSDSAYAKAREVVIGREVLDYPSAGRVLRDVQPGAPNHAEAQQLYNYLLAHGLVHCEELYSEGKADSALLLGRQLHELAEGTPIAASFAGKLALWESVYGAYQRGLASPEASEQAERAWSTILEAETHYGNYYAKRARRGLAAVEEARQAAEAARRPEPPAEQPPVSTLDLRHVRVGQRWVFRRGGAEVEWEIREVQGDTVTYREGAHLPGRENVQPPSLETWTPAALNLGQAQGGGVETRGPQRLDVEGVDLRYVVRKVGAVEHWVAVGRDGQPTFPGIVRDVRQGGSIAVELLRVE